MMFVSVTLFLLLAIYSVNGKFVKDKFSLQTKGFHYLTQFGCSLGECSWKARVKIESPWVSAAEGRSIGTIPPQEFAQILKNSSPSSIQIRVLLDETWESSPVNRRPSCASMDLARITRVLTVPINGEWSGLFNRNVVL